MKYGCFSFSTIPNAIRHQLCHRGLVEITGLKLCSRNWGKPASISPRRAALELSNGVFQIWNASKQKIADLDVRPIFLEVGGKFLSL